MTVFDGTYQSADVQDALTALKIASVLGEDTKTLYANALAAGATLQQIEDALS